MIKLQRPKFKLQSPGLALAATRRASIHPDKASRDLLSSGLNRRDAKHLCGLSTLFSNLLLLFLLISSARAAASDSLFTAGSEAYLAGDYHRAARAFRESIRLRAATGSLQNLGNAEWQLGNTGRAVLAWEQSLWIDPFNEAAYTNLRFARKTAQLESPELAWYEVVSSWLPADWWAWIAGLSFWLAVAIVLLPSIFRWRRLAWQQALAALGLAVFLLSVPANVGVASRSRLGFVLQKNTALRLTPTKDAQLITRLPAGEPARLERVRGRFALIRTNRTTGWIERDLFGLTSAVGVDIPNSVRPAAGSLAQR